MKIPSILLFGCFAVAAALGAQVQTRTPPAPPPSDDPPPPEGTFDPYRAEKNVEIGRYYLKKGNYDAAIERFEEATHYKPRFAIPERLLGEAYEKKGDKTQALQAYRKYLEILPHAADADRVRKRIGRLAREVDREDAATRSRPAPRN